MRKAAVIVIMFVICLSAFSCSGNTPDIQPGTEPSDSGTGLPAAETTDHTETAVITEPVTEVPAVCTLFDEPVVIKGSFDNTSRIAKITSANTYLHLGDMNRGTFSATIIASAKTKSGLIFGYGLKDSKNNYFKFTIDSENNAVILSRVSGSRDTVILSHNLSASHDINGAYEYKVVITGNEALCYFRNILYAKCEYDPAGDGFGLFSEAKNTRFYDTEISETAEYEKYDMLLFGHSYMELWKNWAADFAGLTEASGCNSIMNIGIGGSKAGQWLNLTETISSYEPKIGIFWIGINELAGGMSPALAASQVERILLAVRNDLPEFKCVVLSCSKCPSRTEWEKQIADFNNRLKILASSYDWILYAEAENAFCNARGVPVESYFTDRLHPTSAAYKAKIIPILRSALKGFNQPDSDPSSVAESLESVKASAYSMIADYSPSAFAPQYQESVQKIYGKMAEKIEGAKTAAEVKNLDFSSEIAEIKKYPSFTTNLFEELTGTKSKRYETAAFTNTIRKSKDNVYSLGGCGWRLSEETFKTLNISFRMSDKSNNVGASGILVNATKTAGGVSGYLINYVTKNSNYIQVFYVNNYYGTSTETLKYIGGWVVPFDVRDKVFRAIVEDGYIYLYNEEDYMYSGKDAYSARVDLTNKGTYALFSEGSVGILHWNDVTVQTEIISFSSPELLK